MEPRDDPDVESSCSRSSHSVPSSTRIPAVPTGQVSSGYDMLPTPYDNVDKMLAWKSVGDNESDTVLNHSLHETETVSTSPLGYSILSDSCSGTSFAEAVPDRAFNTSPDEFASKTAMAIP